MNKHVMTTDLWLSSSISKKESHKSRYILFSSLSRKKKTECTITHADLKAPVIYEEICKNPTKEWEKRMKVVIERDNGRLIEFIQNTLGE